MPEGHHRTVQPEDLLVQLSWVQRLARRLAGDSNVAADVTQDVWLRTHQRKIGSGGGLQRWLSSVTRGLVRDTRREADRRAARERIAARPEAQPSTSEVVERNALQQKVSAAVMALDEPYRSTILYRYMDDLSSREIAERMSVTEDAVRQRLARARKTLEARLDKDFGGPSGAWALAILGSLPADRLAAVGSTAVSTTTTATGAGSALVLKAAAVGVVVAGSVVTWRGISDSEGADLSSNPEQASAALVPAYDWDENEIAAERSSHRRESRVLVHDKDSEISLLPLSELGLDDEPDNEYVLSPLQMW